MGLDFPKTRKEAEERLIIGMKNVLTKEQYDKFINNLKELPDNVFWGLVIQSILMRRNFFEKDHRIKKIENYTAQIVYSTEN